LFFIDCLNRLIVSYQDSDLTVYYEEISPLKVLNKLIQNTSHTIFII